MMNCHQATRLMSEARERRLSLTEKLALRFHQSMCAGCRRFEGQVGFIGKAARRYVTDDAGERDRGEESDRL